jgi:hypothetical protein
MAENETELKDTKKRNAALPIVALGILFYGVSAIWMKKVAFIDGLHEASGAQAQFIGVFCIAFSAFILACYFYSRKS